MKIPIYQIDAFTSKVFQGNPAAVCPLSEWLPDHVMQSIALENNLSETAFLVKDGVDYHIRWFTPTVEVDLCGHATLASAKAIFSYLGFPGDEVRFHSKSGLLKVKQHANGSLTLDFPASPAERVDQPSPAILMGLRLGEAPIYKGKFDYMVVLKNQQQVEMLKPDFKLLAQETNCRGVVVTAPGHDSDFVSRCFYPQSGIDEDPVTGSAHTMMMPYWAERLGANRLSAIQLSSRKGYLDCELVKDRVLMTGSAVTYLKGEIEF